MKARPEPQPEQQPAPPPEASPLANGADEAYKTVIDDIDAAVDQLNIDDRPSVLTELPKDLFVEERAFTIPDKEIPEEMLFGTPGSQEVVHCHPDPDRKKCVWGIKDQRAKRGQLVLITDGLYKQYPRLRSHCKLYVIRQYVTENGLSGLWPAPLPGQREAPSDQSHLNAHETSIAHWVRLEWNGSKFTSYIITEDLNGNPMPDPIFLDESWGEVLLRGLATHIATNPDHRLIKHLLRGTPT
jgi:hypothetical protein